MAGHMNQPVPTSGANAVSGTLVAGIIFTAATRDAAVYTSDPLFNAEARGVRLFIDIAADAGGGTVTVKIQVKDPNTDTFVDLTGATTAALTEAGAQTKTLTVYPGITTAAGNGTTSTEASNHLGDTWRVVATVSTDEVTFSVGAVYLL